MSIPNNFNLNNPKRLTIVSHMLDWQYKALSAKLLTKEEVREEIVHNTHIGKVHIHNYTHRRNTIITVIFIVI